MHIKMNEKIFFLQKNEGIFNYCCKWTFSIAILVQSSVCKTNECHCTVQNDQQLRDCWGYQQVALAVLHSHKIYEIAKKKLIK